MATRKTAEKPAEPVVEEKAEVIAEPAEIVDEWSIMEDVTLPRPHGDEAKSLPVWVNGKGYFVPKGKTSSVPKPIADRIRMAYQAEERAEEYAETIPNEG